MSYVLPAEIETELLRVGQEAVANAIRHSGAKKITVSLRYLPHEVSAPSLATMERDRCNARPDSAFAGWKNECNEYGVISKSSPSPRSGTAVCASVAV